VVAGVTVSEGLHWLEDGVHVIRSSEYDLMGQGDDLHEAVRDFVGQAFDLFAYLTAEIEQRDATDHELRMAAVLGSRLGAGSIVNQT
jgi:hypothetical protein